MKTFIREIFQEEFKKQPEKIINLISGKLKLMIQEILVLKKEINDLIKSLEFTQNTLEKKVGSLEKRMRKLYSDIQKNL